MSKIPQPISGGKGFPPPAAADYSDEFSDEQWAKICELTEEHQNLEGAKIISGEPW